MSDQSSLDLAFRTPPRPSARLEATGDAPVRLGLLLNPSARGIRAAGAAGARKLAEAVGDGALVAETRSPAEVGAALRRLVRQQGVNTLAVAGGDGTLHLALNELIAMGREARARGEPARAPRLLPLRGGTLNIIARAAGGAADPHGALSAFAREHRGAPASRVPSRQLSLLRVEGPEVGERYGCIFGSEMVKNALELYDRFGGGYEGLSRFLFEAVRGYLFNTSLWKQEGWRMTPPPFGLHLHPPSQGPRPVATYSAAVASTVDLTIGGGVVRTLRRQPHHEGFFARVITEARTGPLLKLIPSLMRELPLEQVIDEPEARGLDLHGAFTLDGECYGASTRPPAEPPPLRVRAAEESVELVAS